MAGWLAGMDGQTGGWRYNGRLSLSLKVLVGRKRPGPLPEVPGSFLVALTSLGTDRDRLRLGAHILLL